MVSSESPGKGKDQLRILNFFAGVSIGTSPIFIFVYWKLGSISSAIALCVAIPLLLFTYAVWKVSRSTVVAGNWIIAVGYGLFLYITCVTGGLDAPALLWSMVIPVVATVLCGPRSGAVWLVLVALKLSFFYFSGHFGYAFTQQFSDRSVLRTAFYVNALGVIAFTLVLASISEVIKSRYLKETEESNRKLQEALENIRTLNKLLPICAWCKRIRDDRGYWDEVESYFSARTDSTFSHGICPQCAAEQVKKLDETRPENP